VSQNADALRRGFESFNLEGVEAILDLIDPEFVAITTPDVALEPDTYRGEEGLRRYFSSFYEVMEDIRFEPEEFIEVAEKVIVPFVLKAKGKGTGIEVQQRAVQVWTMRDGKALRVDTFPDLDSARDAVAAGEQERTTLSSQTDASTASDVTHETQETRHADRP
jgi:ketosteroid isomerase-like protein